MKFPRPALVSVSAFTAAGALLALPGLVSAHTTNHARVISSGNMSRPAHVRAASREKGGVTNNLHSPICVIGHADPGGASAAVFNEEDTVVGPEDSLDIDEFGVATDLKAGTITAAFQVTSLTDGPGGTPLVTGAFDVWELNWTDSAYVQHFLRAQYPGQTPDSTTGTVGLADYYYGSIDELSPAPNVQSQQGHRIHGEATGHMDLAHNTIYVTAKFADLGLKPNDVLHNPQAASYAGVAYVPTVVTLGYPAKTVGEDDDTKVYVGFHC